MIEVNEIRIARSVEEANSLLGVGWRLLEIVTRHVVRPQYILGAKTHDVVKRVSDSRKALP